MKLKKVLAVTLIAAMTAGMAACGNTNANTTNSDQTGTTTNNAADDAVAATESGDAAADDGAAESGALSYADITLGEDYTDLTTTITVFNHRTDLQSADYNGTTWDEYLAAFNEMYPNITVEITTDTNYADDALMHLQSGDYETIMMIPAVDKADLSNYLLSYGDLETMQGEINYATTWEYGGEVYGVPSTATTQGIVTIRKYLKRQASRSFRRLRMSLSQLFRQLRTTPMRSRFTRTMQQAGRWAHGMLTSEATQPATIHT